MQTLEVRPMGRIAGFRAGLVLLAEGIGFLRRERSLWALAWVPVLFALLGVMAAVTIFSLNLTEVHGFWSERLPVLEIGEWWSHLWVWPLRLLFWAVVWLAVIVSFALSLVTGLLIANLASAPFLDRLSQCVETIELGSEAAVEAEGTSLVGEILKSFWAELQRLSFLAGLWIVFTMIGFIVPGAHLITAPLLVAITILFLPLDYAGFALDRHGVSFRERRAWLWQQLPTMVGFGGIAFVACLVPGLNLLIMPSLVTAGTLLVVRSTGDWRGPASGIR